MRCRIFKTPRGMPCLHTTSCGYALPSGLTTMRSSKRRMASINRVPSFSHFVLWVVWCRPIAASLHTMLSSGREDFSQDTSPRALRTRVHEGVSVFANRKVHPCASHLPLRPGCRTSNFNSQIVQKTASVLALQPIACSNPDSIARPASPPTGQLPPVWLSNAASIAGRLRSSTPHNLRGRWASTMNFMRASNERSWPPAVSVSTHDKRGCPPAPGRETRPADRQPCLRAPGIPEWFSTG